MKNSRVLIVEDDPFIAHDLQRILIGAGYVVTGICDRPEDALLLIREASPDLILLDIQLNASMTGIDLAQRINAEFSCPFIFITAYVDEETVRKVSYTNPQGYISKPYNQADLLIGVELALRRARKPHAEAIPKEPQLQFVKTSLGLERINTDDILYLEANDYYAFLHFEDKKILASSTLKQLEQDLALPFLCRIHRSYVVNLRKVERIVGNELEIGKTRLPISRSQKEKFLEKIHVL